MKAYKRHLAKDLKFKKLLKIEIKEPSKKKNIVMKLVASILAQQLSTRVAQVMLERFLVLFKGKEPKASEILKISIKKIRDIGISESKANYIHNVAQFVIEHKITDKKLERLSDEEIIELFVKIKGVGRWTVEMLLIFALGRKDVFAVDDLGIQQGMQKLFKLEYLKGKELKEKMLELSLKWSPYRSYACLYLWGFKDLK